MLPCQIRISALNCQEKGFPAGFLEAYRSSLPNYVDEEGNAASSQRTTVFPVDWEADLEAYRSSLPNYVDEDGNAASSSGPSSFP